MFLPDDEDKGIAINSKIVWNSVMCAQLNFTKRKDRDLGGS